MPRVLWFFHVEQVMTCRFGGGPITKVLVRGEWYRTDEATPYDCDLQVPVLTQHPVDDIHLARVQILDIFLPMNVAVLPHPLSEEPWTGKKVAVTRSWHNVMNSIGLAFPWPQLLYNHPQLFAGKTRGNAVRDT